MIFYPIIHQIELDRNLDFKGITNLYFYIVVFQIPIIARNKSTVLYAKMWPSLLSFVISFESRNSALF